MNKPRFSPGTRVRVFESAKIPGRFTGTPDYGTVKKPLAAGGQYIVRIDGEDYDVTRALDRNAALPDDHAESLAVVHELTRRLGEASEDAILIHRVFALAHGFGEPCVSKSDDEPLEDIEFSHPNGTKMSFVLAFNKLSQIVFSGWSDGEAWAVAMRKETPFNVIAAIVNQFATPTA